MFRTRLLARLVIPVLVATMWQTLVAGEPLGTTPPAKSIREWKSTPTATPTADAAATTQANSIHEWKSTPIATPTADAAATPRAKSIHEWRSTPTATPTADAAATPTDSAAKPAANSAAKPAVSAAVPTSPMTISITSTLRQGNLVVMLDDVPIFNEKFQKPLLLITQTTTWDPLQVAAGEHRLSAKVYGMKKTYFSSLYDLHVSRTKGSGLRFVLQGDRLTVDLAS